MPQMQDCTAGPACCRKSDRLGLILFSTFPDSSIELFRSILWRWHEELEMLYIQARWQLAAVFWFIRMTCAACFYHTLETLTANLPAKTHADKRADTKLARWMFYLMVKHHKQAQTLSESEVWGKQESRQTWNLNPFGAWKLFNVNFWV